MLKFIVVFLLPFILAAIHLNENLVEQSISPDCETRHQENPEGKDKSLSITTENKTKIGYTARPEARVFMKGYIGNIEKASLENEYFRKVLYTAKNMQLVLMSLKPREDIGKEIHQLDQFIRCESGEGKVILNDITHKISDGFAIIIPAGVQHNIINTSSEKALKLYTLYAPPNHRDGVIHKTKATAEGDDEHFDGVLTE